MISIRFVIFCMKIEILDIICDFLTVCSMIAVAGNLGLAGLLMVQILSGNAGEV